MSIVAMAGMWVLCVLPWTALAQDAEDETEASRSMQERCIPLNRVRNVDIVDDRTIIWEVRGSRYSHYRMTLEPRCPGLKARGAFVHSSTSSRLCDIGEWIRVAGGSRAVCPVSRIEPWEPPAEDAPEEEEEASTE